MFDILRNDAGMWLDGTKKITKQSVLRAQFRTCDLTLKTNNDAIHCTLMFCAHFIKTLLSIQ